MHLNVVTYISPYHELELDNELVREWLYWHARTHARTHGHVKNIMPPAAHGLSGKGRTTQTHPFNSPLSGTTCVSWYQKGKTSLDFTEARDSEWQWHQLGCMQVCTWLQTDNHQHPTIQRQNNKDHKDNRPFRWVSWHLAWPFCLWCHSRQAMSWCCPATSAPFSKYK